MFTFLADLGHCSKNAVNRESDMLVKRVVSAHRRLYAVAVLLLLIDIGLSGNQFGYEHRYRAWNTESEDSD